jgi:hypothetical protein
MVDAHWRDRTTADGAAVDDADEPDGREDATVGERALGPWIATHDGESVEFPDRPGWGRRPDYEVDVDFSGEIPNDDGDFRVLDS